MSNYLITGAAGFMGSRVSEMLIEQGHAVTGVDNLNDALMADERVSPAQVAAMPEFEFVKKIFRTARFLIPINNLQSQI